MEFVCAAFVPLPDHAFIFVLTLVITVTLQEAARYGVYIIHEWALLFPHSIPWSCTEIIVRNFVAELNQAEASRCKAQGINSRSLKLFMSALHSPFSLFVSRINIPNSGKACVLSSRITVQEILLSFAPFFAQSLKQALALDKIWQKVVLHVFRYACVFGQA